MRDAAAAGRANPGTFIFLLVFLLSPTAANSDACTATVTCGPHATASCSVKAFGQKAWAECGAVEGKALTCKRTFRDRPNSAVTYICCTDREIAFSTTDPADAVARCVGH